MPVSSQSRDRSTNLTSKAQALGASQVLRSHQLQERVQVPNWVKHLHRFSTLLIATIEIYQPSFSDSQPL
jgi:hypothetical protein